MKINLLYFCSDFKIGLTQAQTEQVEHLAKESELNLICISSQNEQEPGLHKRLSDIGVQMEIVNDLDVHKNASYLMDQIASIMIKYSITHVNVQNNWQFSLLSRLKLRVGFRQKFKLIYTIHGYRHNHPVKAGIAIAAIGSALGLFSDSVISMSDYVSKRFWFLRHKMDRVFYLMNKPEYNKSVNFVRTDKLSMVFPAQFRKGKRQEMLVKAVRRYIDITDDDSIELHLPGDGPLLSEIKTLVAELQLEKNVKFYGKITLDEVIKLYENCNIALCSSNVETYGRCIAEPFMLGRCVITQKTGVAGDIIKHGENGLIFRNEKDLTGLLIKLHQDTSEISRLANQAFVDREVFYPQNVMNTYLKVLKNL